ncbi:MAG: PaaI family thioesterase [Myxococcota bacterium]
MTNVDSGDDLQRIDSRERNDNTGSTWPAKRRLASALRKLIGEMCPTGASEDEILQAAEWTEDCAERFAAAPRAADDPLHSGGPRISGMHDFLDRGPLTGLSNPIAPGLKTETDSDARSACGFLTFGNAYEGAPGIVHGGFVAAALDELLGMVAAMSGTVAMTGEFTVRYLKPTPINVPLRIEARLDRCSGRRVFTSAEIFAGQTRTAECTGLFIAVGGEKFEELERANLQNNQEHDPAR